MGDHQGSSSGENLATHTRIIANRPYKIQLLKKPTKNNHPMAYVAVG